MSRRQCLEPLSHELKSPAGMGGVSGGGDGGSERWIPRQRWLQSCWRGFWRETLLQAVGWIGRERDSSARMHAIDNS